MVSSLYLRREASIAVQLCTLALLSTTACSSSTAEDGEPDTSETSESSDASDGADNATDEAETSSDGGTSACAGMLCGDDCCDGDEMCLHEQCVPRCESALYCGTDDTCCAVGELCVDGACREPGPACATSWDCPEGFVCETLTGRCTELPLDPACALEPAPLSAAPVQEWKYNDEQIVSTPLVADVDGDGVMEMVVNLTRVDTNDEAGAIGWWDGEVAVLNAENGFVELQVDHQTTGLGSHGRAALALGDVDGDGLPDIVYPGRTTTALETRSEVHAVNHLGELLWTANDGAPDFTPHRFLVSNGGPTLVNLDADPQSEVVIGAAIIDHDGTVLWDEAGDGGSFGGDPSYAGPLAAVADLDGDGRPEISTGRHVWSLGEPLAPTVLWSAPEPDGHPAIADLDGNGSPEVILVADGSLRIYEGATGDAWCALDTCDASELSAPLAIAGGGRGGPPAVADFDGDGRPEIAVAGGTRIAIYDIHRPDEDIVSPDGPPALGQTYLRWSSPTQDASSNSTGVSAFDFNADGATELVYADECFARIYDGANGDTRVEIPNSSGTVHEYPIVADIDMDGGAELLVVANSTEADNNCGGMAGYVGIRKGLYAYGDPTHRWAPARPIWTQHTYHVTNADAAGNVPMVEVDNWSDEAMLNDYRRAPDGPGAELAPDLNVSLGLRLDMCPDALLPVATIHNGGSRRGPAGVPIEFLVNGEVVETRELEVPLRPGQSIEVGVLLEDPSGDSEYAVRIGGATSEASSLAECTLEDNEAQLTGACP